MSFTDNFFRRGRINLITGNPGVGKSHSGVVLAHKSLKYGKRVLCNICMFKKENIPEAKRRGWLRPNKNYLEVPENFQYVPTASELIIEASKGDNNIVVVDEAGIIASSSKALSNTSVQMKFLGMSIRKIGACLILIAQDEDSVVPLLRSKIVTYKVDVLMDEKTKRRDLQFYKAHKIYLEGKGKTDIKFLPHGPPIRNIPMVELPYDTQHPGGFIWDINLEELYREIARRGYDSVEISKHIEGIVRNMVADNKIDDFLKRKKFMRTGTVAELFHVDPRTIQRWVESKKLNAIKDQGGNYLFSRAEVTKKAIEMGLF